jgi:hypothetical protein
MRDLRTGLLRKWRESAGNCCGISEIQANLVFRGADDQCSHNANEISTLQAELVFRDVPGKLVERRWHSQQLGGFGLRRGALIDSPCDGVAGVPITPVCLGLLTARRLAFRLPASALPASHSRVRPEPPATDRARSLPGLGHRDDLSSSSNDCAAGETGKSVQNAWVISAEQRWVTSCERRSCDCRFVNCVIDEGA